MSNFTVWSQWEDLQVPEGFVALNEKNHPLESSDNSIIEFYVPTYMGGRKSFEYVHSMSNLKVFQLPNAGYDDALEFLQPNMVICNARGVHDASTAELAIGLAISARRGFADFMVAQQQGTWLHSRYHSFNDSNIAIIGNGSIGQTLKKYLQPYDVKITMYSRSGSEGSLKISELDKNISEYDIIFLILPLTDESKNLFDERQLFAMKEGATLVNVARGPIVNTDALIKILNEGRITAGIDVTDPEPLPSEHPLWKAKNLIITPHVGGDSRAFEPRGKKLVEDQLLRISQNEKLINVVARGSNAQSL
jgi:phosphoglycerate dehydrogenase-like enzyme